MPASLFVTLFHSPQAANEASKLHDLLLATTCIIDAEPGTIDRTLQREIADSLVRTYEEAQRKRRFDDCTKIEAVTIRWLVSLPNESYQPALPLALKQAICDTAYVSRQRAVLTLLSMIAQQITDSPPLVFDMLIPPLLALAGLPAVLGYAPDQTLKESTNFDVVDLALTALSFFGKRGPAGILLPYVRQYFKDHPAQLRDLARYSLESGTLLTLTVVPLEENNYRHYETAVGEWLNLRDRSKTNRFTEREVDKYLAIHQTLLDYAEEVCYPTYEHFLNMLQAASNQPEQWKQCWQNYLQQQLTLGKYISYQEIALLWAMLFPERQMQELLASLILADYDKHNLPVQSHAQRFLASLSNDLRDLRNLRYLRYLLLTREVAEKAKQSLPSAYPIKDVDLLTIILGRILQMQEADEVGDAVEREVQQLAKVVHVDFKPAEDGEVRESVLDILRYLPACTPKEIAFVLQLAETATQQDEQNACADAFRRSEPNTPEALTALELGKQSKVEVVRATVEERFTFLAIARVATTR